MEPGNRFQGMTSASLCSLAGWYDNPIPPRFLAPIDCLKFPAQVPNLNLKTIPESSSNPDRSSTLSQHCSPELALRYSWRVSVSCRADETWARPRGPSWPSSGRRGRTPTAQDGQAQGRTGASLSEKYVLRRPTFIIVQFRCIIMARIKLCKNPPRRCKNKSANRFDIYAPKVE